MFKAKKLTVAGETSFYVSKGVKYFPAMKFSTLVEAEEEALKRNVWANYDRAIKYFEKLEKLMPEKYDDSAFYDSDKTNFRALIG